jgi:hypothetical protein
MTRYAVWVLVLLLGANLVVGMARPSTTAPRDEADGTATLSKPWLLERAMASDERSVRGDHSSQLLSNNKAVATTSNIKLLLETNDVPDTDRDTLSGLNLYSPRAAVTSKYLSIAGDCIKIGVKSEGSFGNGNVIPNLQYNKACTGSFPDTTEYISNRDSWNCRFEAIAVTLNGELFANSNNSYDKSGNCNTPTYTSLVDTSSISNKSGQLYRGTRWNHRLVTHGSKRGKFQIENDIRFNKRDKFIEITTYITPTNNVSELYIGRMADIDLVQTTGDDYVSFTGKGYSTLNAKFLVMIESNQSKQIAGFYTGDASTVGAGIAAQDWVPRPSRFYNTGTPSTTDSLIGISKRFTAVRARQVVSFRYAYVFGESAYSAVSSLVKKGVAGGTPGKVPGCPTCTIVDTGSIGPSEPPYDSGVIELCTTNCGFESGSTSSWDASAFFTVSRVFVRSGSFAVEKTSASSATLSKTIAISDAKHTNAIDKGTSTYTFTSYLDPGDSEKGVVQISFYNASGSLIGTTWDSGSIRNSREEWTQVSNSGNFPKGTRSVKIQFAASRTSGSNTDLNIDDVSLKARFQYTP